MTRHFIFVSVLAKKAPLCSYLCIRLRGFLGRHLIHIAVIELWPWALLCHPRPQVIHTPQKHCFTPLFTCLGHKCREWESPIYWKRVGRLQAVLEWRKEKECKSFRAVKQFHAREARESLSLQHVAKDHKAVGFKYLSLSFFLSPQSLGAAIDSRGDFLGQGQGDWRFWGKPEFVAPVNSG